MPTSYRAPYRPVGSPATLDPMLQTILVALAVGFGISVLANICTTVYLHRTLSHRALSLHPVVDQAFRSLIWITPGIRPRQWVAVHRKHHAFTDVEGDPHSPLLEGFAMVQFGNVSLHRKDLRPDAGAIVERSARAPPADAWDGPLFDKPFLGLGI